MDNIWLAIIAIIGTLLTGPIAQILLANNKAKQDRLSREEDRRYRLEDESHQREVAGRLLEATNHAAEQRAENTSRLVEIKEAQVKQDKVLAETHVLVNSNLWAVKQSNLELLEQNLALQREVATLKEAAGLATTDEMRASMAATSDRINKLRTELSAAGFGPS